MEVLIAMFALASAIAAILLCLMATYLGYRTVHGAHVYLKYRGARVVICPETQKAAVVDIDARSMGLQAILGQPRLRLCDCSRWALREECMQDCLTQIESRPSELGMASPYQVA